MTSPFLTAEWTNLCLVSYKVEPDFVKKRIPDWLEPDVRDGGAFVTLLGLEMRKVKVLGVSWPGFQSFPEINLRAYVRYGDRRGVFFMRELCPQPAVAWIARTIYNEPFFPAAITASAQKGEKNIETKYSLLYGGKEHMFSARGIGPAVTQPADSWEQFFKEHRWGFGQSRSGTPLCFEVQHPVWQTYSVESVSVDLNWQVVYGDDWSFLQGASPFSTIIAAGSQVNVFPARKLAKNCN